MLTYADVMLTYADIVWVEQICPFPYDLVGEVVKKHLQAEVYWVQVHTRARARAHTHTHTYTHTMLSTGCRRSRSTRALKLCGTTHRHVC